MEVDRKYELTMTVDICLDASYCLPTYNLLNNVLLQRPTLCNLAQPYPETGTENSLSPNQMKTF